MLSLPASVRVFAAREHVDFRKGFDGLCILVPNAQVLGSKITNFTRIHIF